ncbi:voltage-gated potassium channel [Clostridium algifaecis]|uniref:Voltage-gated potassium channel n=1 Tax=Clostridium algifaecis TaxID=1472040 RepID=A0ABS4KQ64_9CLOT|nr:potassium channel family protein [Clostridium algifaecis]MBP2032182.1 voltage-gated potassium channel [Clostridium algifaecis]
MITKIQHRNFELIYDVFMSILAFLAIAVLILQSASKPSYMEVHILAYIDDTIWTIFTIDYFTRFVISRDKKTFVKKNIIDLIAIMPFNIIFQSFRIFESVRLFKLIKILNILRSIKALAFFLKFQKYAGKFMKTNNFNYALQATVLIIFIGAIGLHLTEGRSFGDAIWWSFVTTTTVGYGDISPSTTLGRIIASILMITGIGFIGILTSTISSYFIDKKLNNLQGDFKSEVIRGIKKKLDNFDRLSNEDVNNICEVLRALKKKS